uniref:Uncharacterized protein n=1 Tax=Ditylenchus dipsaci TaxID=166011 RepID=A0A915DDX0_9BILA
MSSNRNSNGGQFPHDFDNPDEKNHDLAVCGDGSEIDLSRMIRIIDQLMVLKICSIISSHSSRHQISRLCSTSFY